MSRLRAVKTVEVVAAVMGVALLASCSSPPEQGVASATLSPAPATQAASPSPTPTPTDIDTATVPDDITPEYVQAVMDDLDEALGRVYRDVAESRELGEAYEAAMRDVYTPFAADVQSRGFRRAIGVRRLARQPENPVTDVLELIEAGPDCVYFSAERDLNPLLRDPIDTEQPYYIALERGTPTDLNPTAWLLAMEAFYRTEAPPDSVCGGAA
jgi:hypothetical protein